MSGLPQPALPPPTSALPQLPVSKIRTPSIAQDASSRLPSASSTPSKLALRAPSKINKPSPLPTASYAASSPNIPTLRSTSTAPSSHYGDAVSAEKELRRSVSIANFPQPPKVRRTGIESKNSSATASPTSETAPRRHSGESRKSSLRVKKLKPAASTDMLSQMYSGGQIPSLLNGSGDGKAVQSARKRGSNDQDSPLHSRSSSAQGSYSTSATTFDEERGREEGGHDVEDGNRRRDSGKKEKEGKGNVIVSVRVRPDAGGDKTSGKDWMVDGRQALIGYRGREGGDYYYGKLRPQVLPLYHVVRLLASLFASIMLRSTNPSILKPTLMTLVQIMYLHLMTRITRSTILRQNDWCVGSWRAIMGQCLLTA